METVASAQQRILAGLTRLAVEQVALDDAAGRVLAEPVVAKQLLPAVANSSMDGYAVIAADTAGVPVSLPVIGESRAGHMPSSSVSTGTAVAIMTGAPLPSGADAVVRREDTDDARPAVRVMVSVSPGNFVREAGEDLRPGDVAVSAGVRLRSHHLAVCAALGLTELAVTRRPRVAIIATGDELVAPGTVPGPGQIADSNSVALAAATRAAGGVPVALGIAVDSEEAIGAALAAATGCDLVITSAGVSVGDHDHVRSAVSAVGTIEAWQVAMRPGRPAAIGSVHGMPFLGLPGNPVSAQVTFELFARPAILALQGAERVHRTRFTLPLAEPVDSPAGLETFHRGVISDGTVRLTGAQGSGISRSLADADCLIVLPAAAERLGAGDRVEIIPLGE